MRNGENIFKNCQAERNGKGTEIDGAIVPYGDKVELEGARRKANWGKTEPNARFGFFFKCRWLTRYSKKIILYILSNLFFSFVSDLKKNM